MRLYAGKIPVIAAEIVKTLVDGDELSVLDRSESELDVQAVLKEYLRLDRECTEKAKDLLQKRNLPYEHFGKIKRQVAAEKAFGLGDEGLDWMTTQMIESFMQSPHVEEVFADDARSTTRSTPRCAAASRTSKRARRPGRSSTKRHSTKSRRTAASTNS